jgi:hypothetical protein
LHGRHTDEVDKGNRHHPHSHRQQHILVDDALGIDHPAAGNGGRRIRHLPVLGTRRRAFNRNATVCRHDYRSSE